jgi:hypothetical protein
MRYFFALLLAVSPLPAMAACPAGLAIYQNLEDTQFSLYFSKQQNPKAWSDIEIRVVGPNINLRFELTASNGYSRNYLVPLPLKTADPESESTKIDFFDQNLKILNLPQATKVAPQYIFSADLGLQLYYSSNGTESPITMPTGMWKLSGCAE